jgi:hypothetical protein
MKIATKLTGLVVLVLCAAGNAFSQASAGIGDVTVYLLQNEQMQSRYTACVQVGVEAIKGYVPGILISARFDKPVSSTIEVNGRAVQTMANSAETSHNENYIKDGDVFRITLTVGSPVQVVYFLVGGQKAFGITELRKVECPAKTKAK